ncbi:hypothetical protein WA026_020753 [Henosepilachna vigintioctopunctata]|uniref:Gustatory receptor n=1 Tax=Henosepilachna vigintioctopunctata TaxID=420089 RepID=A0AAW1TYR8_9CUCU
MSDKLVTTWFESKELFLLFFVFYGGALFCFCRSYYEACREMDCMVNTVYLLEQFQGFQSWLLISITICLVQCINNQYMAIINKLSKNQYKRAQKIQGSKIEGSIQVIEEINTVEEINYIHEQLCDLIDNFNTIFGSNILLVVLSGTLNILIYATRLVQYILKDTGENPDQFSAGTMIEWSFYVLLTVVSNYH